MKPRFLILLICSMAYLANAQKLKSAEVPDAVKASFKQKFDKAKDVKWSKENEKEYEAEFEVGEKEQSATFDSSGKWLGTETEIEKSDLPAPVKSALNKEFAGFTIEEAEKGESPENPSFYEVELKNGKIKYEVQLSNEGKVLKKEEVKSSKKN